MGLGLEISRPLGGLCAPLWGELAVFDSNRHRWGEGLSGAYSVAEAVEKCLHHQQRWQVIHRND